MFSLTIVLLCASYIALPTLPINGPSMKGALIAIKEASKVTSVSEESSISKALLNSATDPAIHLKSVRPNPLKSVGSTEISQQSQIIKPTSIANGDPILRASSPFREPSVEVRDHPDGSHIDQTDGHQHSGNIGDHSSTSHLEGSAGTNSRSVTGNGGIDQQTPDIFPETLEPKKNKDVPFTDNVKTVAAVGGLGALGGAGFLGTAAVLGRNPFAAPVQVAAVEPSAPVSTTPVSTAVSTQQTIVDPVTGAVFNPSTGLFNQ